MLARQLRVFGLVLLVLYAANCLSDILPPRILSPLWQIGMASSLINNGGIAGTGLVMLHLAHHVGHDTGSALALRKTIARWAMVAALGFLLLIPLQISAVTRGLFNVQANIDQQANQIDRQANLYRSAIRNAQSAPQLQRSMQAIQGPVPGAEDLNTPLPELKKSLLRLVDLEAARLQANIDRTAFRQEAWAMVEQTFRICISALALSLGFGVLAQHDVASPTLLIRLWHSIRQLPKALKAKQRENQDQNLAQQAMKRYRTDLARLSKRNKRLAREAQRKQAGSVIEKVEQFWIRASGQNRKGPPRL